MPGGDEDHDPYGSSLAAQGLPQSGYEITTTNRSTENLVSLFCENNSNYRLAMRADGVVLALKNLEDPKQQWIKIDMGDKFKDQEGNPAFVLINKARGQALSHGYDLGDAVTSQACQANSLDSTILWSQGRDEGKGYTAIRLVTNIHLNLDADHGDKKYGGVKDGTGLLIFSWNKQENQKWKIVPVGSEERGIQMV